MASQRKSELNLALALCIVLVKGDKHYCNSKLMKERELV